MVESFEKYEVMEYLTNSGGGIKTIYCMEIKWERKKKRCKNSWNASCTHKAKAN